MTYRHRTMTDDVLDALHLGLDPAEIRELGVLYDILEEKYWEGMHSDYGWDHAAIRAVADALKLSPDDIRNDHDLAMDCFKCIRRRLTGRYKTKIKVTTGSDDANQSPTN